MRLPSLGRLAIALGLGSGSIALPMESPHADAAAPVAPAVETAAPFVVERAAEDKLHVSAQGANLADLLAAIGEQGDFEVVMDRDVERPPVSVTIDDAGVEEVVRRVLRRRSYALMYDEDGSLERVFVMAPPDLRTPAQRQVAERQQRAQERLRRLRAQAVARSAERAARSAAR